MLMTSLPLLPALLADAPAVSYGKVFLVSFLATTLVGLMAFSLRGLWLIFEKTGHEGWKATIPTYHHVIITRIAGLSAWWTLPMLLLIPLLVVPEKGVKILSLVLLFVWWGWLCQRIARKFGKGVGFGLGLTIPGTSFFFRTALAYDKSTYDPKA